MPNFRKKSLSLATAIAGVLTFGSMIGCSDTDNDDPQSLENGSPTVTLETEGGDVTFVGRYNSDVTPLYEMYRGIHYGESTAGENRFEPPVAKELSGTVDATAAGPACPQLASPYGAASENEDCLVLNVYKPIPTSGDGGNNIGDGPYPVMIWIHGGAFIYGSSNESGYNPQDLINKGVIVVTINYRLGALGFLTHADGIEGNFGLMDQQLAMSWVRDNIQAFDGDPDNITLFGESAGGHSVLSHLAAPSSAPYFDKAIVQSGSYLGSQVPESIAQSLGAAFAADPDVDCADAACLRDLPVSTILANQSASGYVPTWDTDFLQFPVNAVLAANTKPVMLGTNLNEGRLFAYIDFLSLSSNTTLFPLGYITNSYYQQKVASLLSNYVTGLTPITVNTNQAAADAVAPILGGFSGGAITTGAVWDGYAASLADGNPSKKAGTLAYALAYSNIYTSSFFACPANYQLNQLVSGGGVQNVYAYEFRDMQAPHALKNILPANPLDGGQPFTGAQHAAEIQYLFGNTAIRTAAGMTAAQRTLATNMMDYWTNFAKSETGNPNADGLVAWSSYEGGAVLRLDDGEGGVVASDANTFRTTNQCSYWEAPPTP